MVSGLYDELADELEHEHQHEEPLENVQKDE